MSLSNPSSRSKSPAKKFIQFSGRRVLPNDPEEEVKKTDGKFYYYNKEKEENVVIDELPPFIVLDGYGFDSNLFSINGWIDSEKAYCWSNEVRSMQDELVVRLFNKQKTVLARGHWEDIAKEVKALGGKYTKSIYVMFKGTNEIANIKFYAGTLSSWLEIDTDDKKFQSRYVVVKDVTKEKIKGGSKYYKLHLDFGDKFEEDDLETALKLDRELQEYFKEYLAKDPSETPVYDREETNTDAWKHVSAEPYLDKDLVDMSFDELDKVRQDLEEDKQEDSVLYQFVCRGCKEKREEKKLDPTKEKSKPEDQAKPKKDPKDFFKKNKTKEKNEDETEDEPSWKSVKMPEGSEHEYLGELSKDDIEELKEYMDGNEDIQKEYSELYEAVQTAVIPF